MSPYLEIPLQAGCVGVSMDSIVLGLLCKSIFTVISRLHQQSKQESKSEGLTVWKEISL